MEDDYGTILLNIVLNLDMVDVATRITSFRDALMKKDKNGMAMEDICSEDDLDMDDFKVIDLDVPVDSGIPILRLSKQEQKALWKL